MPMPSFQSRIKTEHTIGDLDTLRALTNEKFGNLGVQFGDDGALLTAVPKAKAKAKATPKPMMKKPSAATLPSVPKVMKKPAAATTVTESILTRPSGAPRQAIVFPKGLPDRWGYEDRYTKEGRRYPIYFAPSGKIYRSWVKASAVFNSAHA